MRARSLLVVDDDVDMREVLTDLLTDEGFAVRTAANGVEALESLRSAELPCLILLDLMMPVMDGYQFIEAHLADPVIGAVPVALLTASGQLDKRRLRGVPVLPKPVKASQLLDFVERTCAEALLI